MKKRSFILATGLALVVGLVVVLNSCNSRINISRYAVQSYLPTPVTAHPSLRFSIFQTGHASTLEAFVYKGGSLFRTKALCHTAVWVQHPSGSFLFDTGLGDEVDAQFSEMSWLEQRLFGYHKETSVKHQLAMQGIPADTIKTILLSHLHWDHASGIKDFPGAAIVTTRQEYDFAQSDSAHTPAFLHSQYDGNKVRWQFIDFEARAYKNFARSLDYFKDSSVVLVPLQGHTSGSIGMFLTLADGRQFFFTGDVTWSVAGFTRPSAKHRIPGAYVDKNKAVLDTTIVQIHRLMEAEPNLVVIPAHDAKAQEGLKHFPAFEE